MWCLTDLTGRVHFCAVEGLEKELMLLRDTENLDWFRSKDGFAWEGFNRRTNSKEFVISWAPVLGN